MNEWLQLLLTWLSLPEVGLPTLFVVAFVSATLLPMGSEAALFALVSIKPELFWPAIIVALVARGGGPTVRGSRLVAAAVLALRGLHGNWQTGPLHHLDLCIGVGVANVGLNAFFS
jgi:hypothetical protein